MHLIKDIYINILYKDFNINHKTYNYHKVKVYFSLCKHSKRGIHTKRESFIWVYDITNLDEKGELVISLVHSAPFKTKSECAKNYY